MINKKTNWKTRIRNGLAGGLITLASVLPTSGCNSNFESFQNEPIKGLAQTTVATNYVGQLGVVVGRENPQRHGGVNQNLVSLSKGLLSAFAWGNYDLQDKEMHEVDYGTNLNIPISERLNANIGYEAWTSPSGLLGKHTDQVIRAGISHSGIVDTNFSWSHLLDNEDTNHGDLYNLEVSKTFGLSSNEDSSISITPSIKGSVANGFYGFEGLMHVTPGISLDFNKGNSNTRVFMNFQDGKSGNPDQVYAGVSKSWKF